MIRSNTHFFNSDMDLEEYMDENIYSMNKSFSASSSRITKNLSNKSSSLSPLLKALTTKQTSLNIVTNKKSTNFFKNQSTLLFLSTTKSYTSKKIPTTTPEPLTPYILVSYLVDQFNNYRDTDIVSRIKQCDLNTKLNDICELYTFDNHTYSLIREFNIEFQSFQHIYDALIDRIIVQKLNNLCPTGQWCLNNLTKNDIHFTIDVIRQRGRSFCSLEKCHQRLLVQTTSCPLISPRNISAPTLKLLPMLCTLYEEQQIWSTTECNNQIVHLLHILYAFWPQLEICYRNIVDIGSNACTSDCLLFDSIFRKVEKQCNKNSSFLTRVPTLSWYRLINLKQICHQEINSTKSPIISSVKNFISSNMIWYRFHQRPVHVALFIIVIICIIISFSLCLYVMSKNDFDSNTRRIDDDYEYTRLRDSTFELSTNNENLDSNMNLPSTRITNESQFDLNGNHRLSEHQRLLYMDS